VHDELAVHAFGGPHALGVDRGSATKAKLGAMPQNLTWLRKSSAVHCVTCLRTSNARYCLLPKCSVNSSESSFAVLDLALSANISETPAFLGISVA